MTPAVFEAGPYRAFPLREEAVPDLQRFFEENPEYFLAVNGEPARPAEARDEVDTLPPAGMPYDNRWVLRILDAQDAMAGYAGLLSNFLAPGVWHVGTFIVATRLHGSGAATRMYRALEGWMQGQGAQWIRLGVVEGNARAERFWEKVGFVDVRKRHGVEMGRLVNTLRVMAKPLAGGSVAEYLARVPRDRPD